MGAPGVNSELEENASAETLNAVLDLAAEVYSEEAVI
jgi:hypothetical protein